MKRPLLIVVIGPTGVGKTAVAIFLAKHFKTEVVSADSRQMFREIPVGTAAPSLEEQAGVPHHFIGNMSVTESMDAGQWAEQARTKIDELFKQHEVVICAGGSGLYVNALLNGMDDLPGKDENLREQLRKEYEAGGIEVLQKQLIELDPEYYYEVDINNPKRLIRAIEVCQLSGKKYSELRSGSNHELPFDVVKIGLELPREELYARINLRVDEMMKNGLEQEARKVYHLKEMNALHTVGYRELFSCFDGEYSMDKAVELIKQHSRNYAKRQMTWWRRDEEVRWFAPWDTVGVLNAIT
jgi:tRNA dimethylallyltransferase